jgi:hypothetical protein
MKALVRDGYGSPDVLHVRDIDVPVPKENEVLVRVHAACRSVPGPLSARLVTVMVLARAGLGDGSRT